MLFQVEADTEIYLQQYLDCYKRKPFYVPGDHGEILSVDQWDPETYPKHITERLLH